MLKTLIRESWILLKIYQNYLNFFLQDSKKFDQNNFNNFQKYFGKELLEKFNNFINNFLEFFKIIKYKSLDSHKFFIKNYL